LFVVSGFKIFFAFLIAFLLSTCPLLLLYYKEGKRASKFEEQLPDALDFISRALKAGHGISAAISMVGEELAEPAGAEFKITSDQINLGLSFSDALSNLADRIRSNDLNFLVISLVIQRDTGGNLSELLELISKTIRDRLKLKGKVRILASEGKISGWILTLMPFFLGLILYLIKPDYISHLWNTEAGIHMLSVASLMIPLGVFWMWKIVRIKV
jgi:tight adherence protein B